MMAGHSGGSWQCLESVPLLVILRVSVELGCRLQACWHRVWGWREREKLAGRCDVGAPKLSTVRVERDCL